MYMYFWRQRQFWTESSHKTMHFSYDYKCACYKLPSLNINFDRPSTESWEPIQTSSWTVQKGLGRTSCRQLGEHTGSTNNCWQNFISLPCCISMTVTPVPIQWRCQKPCPGTPTQWMRDTEDVVPFLTKCLIFLILPKTGILVNYAL